MVGTFWAGPFHARWNSRAIYEIVEVAPYWNGTGRSGQMVYARRLDHGNRSTHPQGSVRKVSWVGAFTTHHRQISESEAREMAQ